VPGACRERILDRLRNIVPGHVPILCESGAEPESAEGVLRAAHCPIIIAARPADRPLPIGHAMSRLFGGLMGRIGMLWQVANSGLSLLGSVHVLDVPALPLSAAAGAAFEFATRVLFEHDLAQAPDVSFAQLAPSESLSSLIPASLHASVEDRCRDWSMNMENASHLQPWLVAIALSLKTAALAGMDPANGVDKNLLPLARAQGKRVEFLEDAAGALKNFANAPMVEQLKMLSLAAEDVPSGIDFFKRLIGGWKAGRADLVLWCAKERVAQMPVMFGCLIEGRNRAWLPRLRALATESQPTLVVAGAMHMVGPTGLPTMLRDIGHEVIAVDVTGE
jgi:uncharacterized protein YbaP (TraB family)